MNAPDVLTALGETLDDIEGHTEHLADTIEVDKLGLWVAHLNHLARELAHQARHAQHTLASMMPEKDFTAGGVHFERKASTTRKAWDWEMLLPTITRLYVDPQQTGEVPDGPEAVARMTSMIRDVIGVTPSKAPKVKPLRDLGLDPDEWCEATPNLPTVRMTGTPEGSPDDCA